MVGRAGQDFASAWATGCRANLRVAVVVKRKSMTRIERLLFDRLRELEIRLSVVEQLPRPIVFAIGKYYPDPVAADMQWPSEMEH